VTALYEVAPPGVDLNLPGVDPLKYQAPPAVSSVSAELATVKLRYKQPDGDASRLLSAVVDDGEAKQASADLRFASAVVEFGMLLRGSEFLGDASYEQALELAQGALGQDASDVRAEFVELLQSARRLTGPAHITQVR
jgi:Ca-activated chloride channel family protein